MSDASEVVGPGSIAVSTPAGTKEACLDMLLAEELTVDVGFADRVVRVALEDAGLGAPVGPPETVVVTFNSWHEVGDDELVFGENDLDVALSWPDGSTRRVLIEEKVRSPLQPTQAERYRARAEACGAAAIIVAPRDWLDTRAASVAPFHGRHSVEDLADELERRAAAASTRSAWRVALLRALATRPLRGSALDDELTIEFRDHCIDRLRELAPSAVAYPGSLHTARQGWLEFKHPKGLILKASNSRVDLTLKYHGYTGSVEALEEVLARHPAPMGFTPAIDSSKNVVLRHPSALFDTRAGVPAVTFELDRALDACAQITTWVDEGGSELLAATLPADL